MDGGGLTAPRVRTANGYSFNHTATGCDLMKLEGILGRFIATGVGLSERRRLETRQTLTSAVQLHMPSNQGEDCVLEVWVQKSFGDCIAAVNRLSVRDLGGVLGDYLFNSMSKSERRKEEGQSEVGTRAIEVSQADCGDQSLTIVLDWIIGFQIFSNAFPMTTHL